MSYQSYNYDSDYFDEETEANYLSSGDRLISEAMLIAAIEKGMTLNAIADKYRMSFSEVVKLCQAYEPEYDNI